MAGRAQRILETFGAAAVIALLMGPAPRCPGQQTADVATITGFSIPQLDDNGVLKWKVLGDSARFNPDGGPVDITQVKMEMYKNARVDMVLTSPRCRFDREKQEAMTDAPVEIKGKNVVITGTGFFWSGTNNLLVIRRDARAVVANPRAFLKPSTNGVPATASSRESAQ